MPWVEFEFTIPAFERAKTVHALDLAATVIGNLQIDVSKIESEWGLLYDWRFTANQFVLATSPARLTMTDFFFLTEPLRS
jgi:hypothetical protein